LRAGRVEKWVVRTLPDGSTEIRVLDAAGKPKAIDTSKILLPGSNPFKGKP
jgi:filamentous hemagglutinin